MSKAVRIPLEPVPLTIFDKPYRIPDIEAEPPTEVYRCDKCGADIEVVKPAIIERANLVDLLKLLIVRFPRQAITNQDSDNAYNFTQQVRESKDGILEVTEDTYKWLKKTVEEHGKSLYGINTGGIAEALNKVN